MPNGPFFEANLEALKELNPEQAETIASLAPKVEDRLYPVKALDEDTINLFAPSTISGDTYPLYETAQPKDEIETWMDRAEIHQEAIHAVLLFGFGMGDHARSVLKTLPEIGILAAIEPDPILFFTAFFHRDLTPLLRDERLHFYVGQTVEKSVESIGTELKWSRFLALPYRLLVTPLLRKTHPQFAKRFSSLWRDALQRELMYRRARIEHGETVAINTLANTKAVVDGPGVSSLFYHFDRVPAVLAAPGPSLERNIEKLQRFQDRALIGCVNTAYPILRDNGICPHVVFAMDHNERNVLSFHNHTASSQTFLIADPRINPQIIRYFQNRVFLASWRGTTETIGEPQPLGQIPVPDRSGNSIYLWLQRLAGSKGDIYGPGSVAVAGFHILARMGCQPIVLLGQDLAFSENKTYSDGTIFDDRSLPQDALAAHEVESVDGQTLPTSETLHLYKRLLEHEIKRFQVPVYNAGLGAMIEGTIAARLETIEAEMPENRFNVSEQLSMLCQAYIPSIDPGSMRSSLSKAREELKRFAERAKAGLVRVPDLETPLSVEQKSELLDRLKETVRSCSTDYPLALELLNELLQESHFEYEDSRWLSLIPSSKPESLLTDIRNQTRILDSFVRQAGTLGSLLDECLDNL